MAYAYRLRGPDQACIRISRADLPAKQPRVFLAIGTMAYPLNRATLKGDTLTIHDEFCQIERIISRARNRQVLLIIRDVDSGQPEYVEPLLFHHSFFAPFFDFARSAPWDTATKRFGSPEKPALLAVFTHAHDDNEMLRFWEAHYARLVPHRSLYVIDHGSPVSPRTVLNPETNVVTVPRSETDHSDMARFCGSFQRFLLAQHSFVLHSDTDELLVDEGGPQALLAKLGSGALHGVLTPATAYELLHDIRSEAPLKAEELLSTQRALVLPAAEHYKKPLLADMPASWLQGFHQVYEELALREVPGLALIHIHAADARLLREKNRKWNALRQSEADLGISPQHRPESKEELAEWFRQRLADARLTALPKSLRGTF